MPSRMDPTQPDKLVEQVDRDAAADWLRDNHEKGFMRKWVENIRNGALLGGDHSLSQAFAAHRQRAMNQAADAERERAKDDIAAMMAEFVDNWPPHKKLATSIKLIAKTMRAALDPPKHRFWMPGEPDCPREIKAGNGELHTLRCKVCGQDDPRGDRCATAIRLSPVVGEDGERG